MAVGTSLGVTLAAHLPTFSATAAAAAAGSAAVAIGSGMDSHASAAGESHRSAAGQSWRPTDDPTSQPSPHATGPNSTTGYGSSGHVHAAPVPRVSGSGAGGPPPVLVLGEARSEAEAVTALGFSRPEAPSDLLWLLVGHASGAISVWELQRRGPRLVMTISESGVQNVCMPRMYRHAARASMHMGTHSVQHNQL